MSEIDVDSIMAVIRQLDKYRRIVLVPIGERERMQTAVDQLPLDCAPGLFQVQESAVVPPGTFYVVDPNPPELPPFQLYRPEPEAAERLDPELGACAECLRTTGHKMDCSIGRRWRR